ENKTDDLMDLNKKLKHYEGIISGLTTSAVSLFTLAILVVSVLISKDKNFSNILIPTIAMASSFGPVIALSNLSNNLFMTLASGERILNLLNEKPIIEEVYDGESILEFNGLECENVYFDYEGEEILNDYNLQIEPNKIIGISGKSGSGKSTLLKLFMRFWDIKKGNLKISGSNIKDINTDSLRDLESYVTQETSIFKDTIENNIKIADKDATREEVIEACKKASLHDFIMSLPNGYDTNVGELGDTLSGGEKQRIGIARSFLHKAPFMLLDEPTSNLDSLNEAVILKSVKDNSKDRTVVLVSHRLSTLNIADKVYKMKTDRVS
ncbi:ABC transporter ATP-binding protein, partial [Brachyspira pilosicoli]